MPSGSRGSSSKSWRPVRKAEPSTSVMTGGPTDRPAGLADRPDRGTRSRRSIRWRSVVRPRAELARARARSARRADVPLPHGDRSTSPSANTVTLRWVRPSCGRVGLGRGFGLPEDDPVDPGELGLVRVDDVERSSSAGRSSRWSAISAGRLAGSRRRARGRGRRPSRRRRRRRPRRAATGPRVVGPRRRGPARTTARSGTDRLDAPTVVETRRQASRPDGTSTVDLVTGSVGAHPARLDRPRHERDRAVAAGRRVALVVEEDDAQVGAGVVGRRHEARRTCRRGRAARR